MKPIKHMQIGKNGVSESVVGQIIKMMEKEESMKVSILKSSAPDKKAAEKIRDELIEELGNKFTGKLIGHTISLRKWRKARK